MKLFKKQQNSKKLIASLQGQQCRIQLFDNQNETLTQLHSNQFIFTDYSNLLTEFTAHVRKLSSGNTECRWVLGADHYQTHSVESPNVSDNELKEALKWQIKELLDKPVEEMLVSHYYPNHPDKAYNQVNAVAVEKNLVESIIQTTSDAGLTLDAIEIEELSIGNALLGQLETNKVVGFVGENEAGLIFNFYLDGELSFSRYKKGRFIPKQPDESELVLDDELQAQEDSFLLETQRTLDYVVSQIYRRPVDRLLLQKRDTAVNLAETMGQITDTQVDWIESGVSLTKNSSFPPTLAEVGSAKRKVG